MIKILGLQVGNAHYLVLFIIPSGTKALKVFYYLTSFIICVEIQQLSLSSLRLSRLLATLKERLISTKTEKPEQTGSFRNFCRATLIRIRRARHNNKSWQRKFLFPSACFRKESERERRESRQSLDGITFGKLFKCRCVK